VSRPYRSGAREEQARATRARILTAATAVFLDRGWAGATVRGIAAAAGVSVPTVELGFGTKARLLKAAIDVAIAGDDEDVPVLARDWTEAARRSTTPAQLLDVVAAVVGPAQARSAGLVLAALEGATRDDELAELAEQLVAQRAVTARWIVEALAAVTPLRPDRTPEEAADTLWVLMDPALFDRLVRRRGRTVEQYQRWFADTARHVLVPDHPTERTDP
jgi:AcrR family transcriptional regulator